VGSADVDGDGQNGDQPEGVGCLTDGGSTRLVGLRGERTSPNQMTWTRTVVDTTGDQARNGAVQSGTYTSPQDHKGIELLSTVSCGDRRFDQPA
jgi:hypothetical protein